ncbi:MAG: hypothetical protein E7633_02620 [Ruminococcaceae bacterium]|nr:hypothetical protein [Oscillospiraceae bacterium]
MNFIKKNKKIIIISASVVAVLVLATVIGILIARSVADKPKSTLEKIAEITSGFEAHSYGCNIKYVTDEVTLKGEYTLTVEIDLDGQKSAALTYKYDKLNAIGESDDFISEISGTLYAKDENEIGQLKDSAIVWESGVVPSDISPIKISEDIFESFDTKNEDGVLTLEGTLKKGVLEGISDARLTVECAEKDTRMILITLEYTDEYGARVRAVYSYFVENLWGNK